MDLVLVLGGDGAILAASLRLDGKRVPVMGINFGSVGFLAAVAPERAESTLGQVLDGAGRCENRAMMRVQIKRKGKLIRRKLVTVSLPGSFFVSLSRVFISQKNLS